MNKIIHVIRYYLDSDYRERIYNNRKFAHIMAVNKSVMQGRA